MRRNHRDTEEWTSEPPPPMPVFLQFLSMVFFLAFSIVATVLAFEWFWPAGFALAVIIVLRGFGPLGWERRQTWARVRQMAPGLPERPSAGNASFSAYRTDMLDRLEQEQRDFDGFLTRLRDARDKTEFDAFLDDRAGRHALPPEGTAATLREPAERPDRTGFGAGQMA
jgi:hypothetical protein